MNLRFCSPGRILPFLFYFSLLYLLLWCWKPAKGQGFEHNKPLQIGDTIPDVTIRNILHYKNPTARLSDFKGKLLILDFWGTWCSPCVYMIPRMDSLQKQFDGIVQFLPVTVEPAVKVAAFRSKYAKRHGERIAFPEVVSDSVLSKLFFHNAIPHYVWIDQHGVVKAVTEMNQITAEKISTFLANNGVQLAEKKDQQPIPYDQKRPLLAGGNGGDGSNLIYHSVLTGYTSGLQGGMSWNIDPVTGRRITATNCSRFWLYRVAYAKPGGFLDEGSVVIESSNREKLTSTLYGQNFLDWLSGGNGFCYELIVPASFGEKTNQIMQKDLVNFFPEFSASMEDRKRQCLVMRSVDSLLTASNGGKSQITIDPFGWKAVNVTLAQLADRFNQTQNYALNLVDQSGYRGAVDLEIEGDINDLDGFNKQLASYGLIIQKQVIDRQVLVIRDRELTAK